MDTRGIGGRFAARFGRSPQVVVRSPGRINLLGDHTDYNDGLVLPMAIGRSVVVAAARMRGERSEVFSGAFGEGVRLSPAESASDPDRPWARYVAGVLSMLRRQRIAVPAGSYLIGGDLPASAGLASSAALEVGVARAAMALAGATLSPVSLATLCRRAEQEFAGSPCGVMDQLCCTSARSGHALLIDCRSMVMEQVPLRLGGCAWVVVNSGVRHSIAGRAYAQRRRESATALSMIGEADPGITTFRQIEEDRLAALVSRLDGVLGRRLRHVVTETARVTQGIDALRAGDTALFGCLMNESHASLRDDYEVSCAELDLLAETARQAAGVYGARMTGGGFGGCVICLAEGRAVGTLVSALNAAYGSRFGGEVEVFIAESANAVEAADVSMAPSS